MLKNVRKGIIMSIKSKKNYEIRMIMYCDENEGKMRRINEIERDYNV